MIAEKASDAIDQAVCYELQNIVKNYGAVYASSHEAYAVLKEETEEAAECLNLLESHLEEIWKSIKIKSIAICGKFSKILKDYFIKFSDIKC